MSNVHSPARHSADQRDGRACLCIRVLLQHQEHDHILTVLTRELLGGVTTESTWKVLNGFIVGIFNYCDRWCETCAFTSRCRVFADVVKAEASLDPNLKNVVKAPPLEDDLPPPLPEWMVELIDKMNEASREITDVELRQPKLSPQQQSIEARANEHGHKVHAWLQAHDFLGATDPGDPRAVLGWFQ